MLGDNMFHRTNLEATNSEIYQLFLENLEGYLDETLPMISNLANFSALVKYFFDDVNWAGFYLYDGSRLVLGPYQGLPACSEISLDRGVCGKAARERIILNVPRTADFVGHIVCDEASKSELVIPLIKEGVLLGVLDIDAAIEDRFGPMEEEVLSKAVKKLIDKINTIK